MGMCVARPQRDLTPLTMSQVIEDKYSYPITTLYILYINNTSHISYTSKSPLPNQPPPKEGKTKEKKRKKEGKRLVWRCIRGRLIGYRFMRAGITMYRMYFLKRHRNDRCTGCTSYSGSSLVPSSLPATPTNVFRVA